uniref:Uncharacterized protein n=1 Tax=viral metagenome TaxID=1070528 RepID=A0A6C0AC24_9ZZZZ
MATLANASYMQLLNDLVFSFERLVAPPKTFVEEMMTETVMAFLVPIREARNDIAKFIKKSKSDNLIRHGFCQLLHAPGELNDFSSWGEKIDLSNATIAQVCAMLKIRDYTLSQVLQNNGANACIDTSKLPNSKIINGNIELKNYLSATNGWFANDWVSSLWDIFEKLDVYKSVKDEFLPEWYASIAVQKQLFKPVEKRQHPTYATNGEEPIEVDLEKFPQLMKSLWAPNTHLYCENIDDEKAKFLTCKIAEIEIRIITATIGGEQRFFVPFGGKEQILPPNVHRKLPTCSLHTRYGTAFEVNLSTEIKKFVVANATANVTLESMPRDVAKEHNHVVVENDEEPNVGHKKIDHRPKNKGKSNKTQRLAWAKRNSATA